MKTRAADCYEAGKPLVFEEVELDGPREGEVLIDPRRSGVLMNTRRRHAGACDPVDMPRIVSGCLLGVMLVACGADESPAAGLPCNGHVELCSRPYDEVVFAATHNAHAAVDDGYPVVNANQLSGIEQQLNDGVRALLMDVYEHEGQNVLCHGPCQIANTPHVATLSTIKTFLDAHPREVITIIYEDHLAVDRIAADFASVGLDALVYTHTPLATWPTLEAMIENNTRLVVTAESGAPPPAWFHHVWDVAWDTPYTFRSADEFTCELNRGARDNALFLINHWLGTELGLPSEAGAMTVNSYEELHARAQGCWDETNDVPNFVAVDFYEHGDLFDVVNDLNGVSAASEP